MGLTLLEVVLGAVIAIVITVVVENLRKPRLELCIAPARGLSFAQGPAKRARFLGLELQNKPLPRWARWMIRDAALQCHGTITFYHLDTQSIFGRSMTVRWSNSPEPIAMHIQFDGKSISIFDPQKLSLMSIDVFPGEAERLDVAARFDEDEDCFGWNNESYFSSPHWRNPAWKLPKDRFLVKVTVITAGEKCFGVFRLINDVSVGDFRIEPAQQEERIKLLRA